MSAGAMEAQTPTRTTSKPRRERRRVSHLYWVDAAAVACELGVTEVPTVCKRAWIDCTPVGEERVRCAVTDGGGIAIVNELESDCGLCLRILKAETRRRLKARVGR